MPKKHLPPMSGASGDVICIEAKRVCDFCFQEHHVERAFTGPAGPGFTVDCEINTENITCREVSRREIDNGKKKEKELVCVAVTVPVTLTVVNPAGQVVQTLDEQIVFLKQAVLAAPEGTDIECQVTGECCCFIDEVGGMITCAFDFCVILQTKVDVRVLIQTLGVCVPKECKSTVLGCPPKFPEDACQNC